MPGVCLDSPQSSDSTREDDPVIDQPHGHLRLNFDDTLQLIGFQRQQYAEQLRSHWSSRQPMEKESGSGEFLLDLMPQCQFHGETHSDGTLIDPIGDTAL
jgi:hypothetical protein